MDLNVALTQQEQAWNQRPLLRSQYRAWYSMIVDNLSPVVGATVELGSGIGRFREAKPDAVLTDVVPTRWTDAVVDAHGLPYRDGTIANLVLLDVFHHLAAPELFLNEAQRVLTRRGRVVIVDPYCSWVSTPFFRRFHHERTDLSTDAFEHDVRTGQAPLESNQARTTLVFYKYRDAYRQRWPELPIIFDRRFAFLIYPLSGGFTRRPLLPNALLPVADRAEAILSPLSPLLAFRCLVVLERR